MSEKYHILQLHQRQLDFSIEYDINLYFFGYLIIIKRCIVLEWEGSNSFDHSFEKKLDENLISP